MDTQLLHLFVADTIGSVSAMYITPEKPRCIVTLAHGAGAGMDHPFMEALAHSLAEASVATLRFNFPFAERGKGRPDRPEIAHATVAAALAKAKEIHPDLPLLVAGKSFGGRMSSQYLAAYPDEMVRGLIFYGFPLHPAGKPGTERSDHLRSLETPMLFLQGTKDALATWALIESVCRSLPTASLVGLEGVDHSFRRGRADIITKLVAETVRWVSRI